MTNFTSNTYQMKREILTFSNKISRNLSKPQHKFMANMNYGMLASGSCLITDIVDSDVVKPDGCNFETLGWDRDGSQSTAAKNVYKKGYHATEATVLTENNHPVSIYIILS